MSDLLIFAGVGLSSALVGGGIGWTVCSIIAGAKVLAARNELEQSNIRAAQNYTDYNRAYSLLSKAKSAIPPKRARENGAYTKLRRILEGK